MGDPGGNEWTFADGHKAYKLLQSVPEKYKPNVKMSSYNSLLFASKLLTNSATKDNNGNFLVPSGKVISPKQQEKFNELVDKGFLISRSDYNNTLKMKIKRTPKDNWRCYYDGKDTGITINGDLMSTSLAKTIGIYQE